jgi:hypothetical protein
MPVKWWRQDRLGAIGLPAGSDSAKLTDIMRPMLFTIFFALLVGCATAPTSDPIDRLVADYSASRGFFVKGIFPDLNLPKTASQEQVITRALEMHGFTKEQVAGARILTIRQVHIQGIYPELYTAALVQTSIGEKIVLFQYQEPAFGWWSQVEDANRTIVYQK